MRSNIFFTSLSVGLLTAASVWAAAPAPATEAAPAAPAEKTDSTAAPAAARGDTAKDAPTVASPDASAAGERSANSAVFLEGGGAGLWYSVNFDRAFGDFSARVGFSYMSVTAVGTGGDAASASFMTIPITVSYLGIGSVRNMLELGAGATIINAGAGASTVSSSATASATLVWPTVLAGYRFQPEDGGFFFKAGMAGIVVGSEIAIPVLPLPYLALGGTFGP